MPTNNKIHPTSKASFKRIDVAHLGPYCTYPYFDEYIAHAVLVRGMVSMNY
jgi:hypothetical protein